MSTLTVRDAAPADAPACQEIYRPYVEQTAITFETEVPGVPEVENRIASAQRSHAWLVAELDSQVIGFAYAGVFRGREAWQWCTEVSVYLRMDVRRTGAGKALYAELLERLRGRGFVLAIASITLPNEPSAGLHHHLGFVDVGVYEQSGWKFDRWHDVLFAQLRLVDLEHSSPPEALR